MKHFVIITGGGTGSRVGGDVPKQFRCLDGLPMIMHTINKFKSFVDTIIVTLPEQYFDYWKELQYKYNFNIPHIVVAGGNTRFHSVKNAVERLSDDGLVAVHDAVRPLVTPNLIKSCFEHARNNETAVAAISVKDSLRTGTNSNNKGINRSDFFIIQTPQVFSCKTIKRCYNQAFNSELTDDASVVEAFGYNIQLVEGEDINFKITSPTDLLMAELIMSRMC